MAGLDRRSKGWPGLNDAQGNARGYARGDSHDTALAETINDLFKAKVIRRRGPWRSVAAVEHATLERVDWRIDRRLPEPIPEPIGDIPTAEAEAVVRDAPEPGATAAQPPEMGLRQTRFVHTQR